MIPILEVKNIIKHYPKVKALDGVSFSIFPGTCFGLLGPNGAGKTTAIEIMEGILSATSGRVLYKGKPPGTSFREEVGIQFQSTALLSFLTVGETLEAFSKLYKKTMPLEDLKTLCHLEEIWNRDNDKISGGQKQRVLLAIALVNDPELIFLDEPTTGLDPQARRHVWEIVEHIKARGRTLILTTHYMDEAQVLCDEIAIMDRGRIIEYGNPDALLKAHCSAVTLTIPADGVSHLPDSFLDKGRGENAMWQVFQRSQGYEVQTNHVNACLQALLENGVDLSRVTVRSSNLEDLFLRLTGHSLRQ